MREKTYKFIDWLIQKWNTFIIKLYPSKKRDEGELVIYKDGIKKDKKDKRDYASVSLTYPWETGELPDKYELPINAINYVKSQGYWNSCFSHAAATSIEIYHTINKTPLQVPLSERFHYYYVRQPEYMNNFPDNKGQYPREGMKVLKDIGITPEKLCPYVNSEMNDTPKDFANGFAHLWKIKSYYRVNDLNEAKKVLNKNLPILISSYVTKSFLDKTGSINPEDTTRYGGHGYILYGYDDITNELLCINSWGYDWKDSGLFRLPYDYWKKHGMDMWTFDV